MSKQVTVIDFGASNLLNVQNAFEHLDVQVNFATNAEQILAADRLVFPGVGAFPDAMEQLVKKGLVEPIKEAAKQKPFLGICLGMQMMLSQSEEFSLTQGLNLIPGTVRQFSKQDAIKNAVKIPHIGWSAIDFCHSNIAVFNNIDEGSWFYFVHSFHACPDESTTVIAKATLGKTPFTAAIQDENKIGCQFHPEKSGQLGLKLIENFMAI